MDRFTKGAKQALRYAHDEAMLFHHAHIGAEHLLLALIRDDDIAGKVLRERGASLDRARSAVALIIGHGEQSEGAPKLTESVKKVIERAVDEARTLNHHHVGTEHLLLGLIVTRQGMAQAILEELEIDRRITAQLIFEKIGFEPLKQHAVMTNIMIRHKREHDR